jgi:hypothetical protein
MTKKEYTISGRRKKEKTCVSKKKRKTNDKVMQSMPLGKQLRREFRRVYTTVGEQETYHYPKTSKLNSQVVPDSN